MMKFRFEKKERLNGKIECFFIETASEAPDTEPFRIIANAEGIRFEGDSCPLTDQGDLESFAATVGDAWKHHCQQRDALRKKLMGE